MESEYRLDCYKSIAIRAGTDVRDGTVVTLEQCGCLEFLLDCAFGGFPLHGCIFG